MGAPGGHRTNGARNPVPDTIFGAVPRRGACGIGIPSSNGPVHDQPDQHLQAVRPPDPLRGDLLPAQSRREGRPGRPQRRRQDHRLPADHRRGGARRGHGHGAQAHHHRLLPPGHRRDVRPLGAGRDHRRQRRPRRAASRTGGSASTPWPTPTGPTRWTRSSHRFGEVQDDYQGRGGYELEARAREVLHGPRLRRRPDRRRRRARCRAAGRCASAWPGCCSAGPTCC